MRPKKLTLCGWGPYRNKVEIDFTVYEEQGIFLITGATGAGKTTIFDAVTYALYGSLSGEIRDKERNSVRSDFAEGETPTYVDLAMEHGGKQYRIRRNPRYQRPKKRSRGESAFVEEKENAVLYLPGDEVIEGVKEVNARLQEILVLDYRQFKQISMIAQGEFARLLTAPPREKTRIFREIFGTGIYDRFTAQLGLKARRLYAKVMEHKHKLEEDIRVLTVGLEKSGWSPETRDRLLTLADSENWNYEELEEVLGIMEEEACLEGEKCGRDFSRWDRQAEKLSENLTKQKEENRRAQQLQKAKEEREQILQRKAEFAEKEKRFRLAVNAGMAEAAAEKVNRSRETFEKNGLEQERLAEEIRRLEEEQETLNPVALKRETLDHLLDKAALLAEKQQNLQDIIHDRKEKETELEAGRQEFLKLEEGCRRSKVQYESADRERKHAAIGIAAGMLVEGRPCPVCGSTVHPAPAAITGSVISEEELEILKKNWEDQQQKLNEMHSQVVAVKTRIEGLVRNERQLTEITEALQQSLEEERDPIIRHFMERPAEESRQELNDICSRVLQLQGLMEEKKSSKARLMEEEKQLETAVQKAKEEFAETLKQYGFRSRPAYERARMGREEREGLSRELEGYKNRAAANRELYDHLKSTVKSDGQKDLSQWEEELRDVKAKRTSSLEAQKLWDSHLKEVRRTLKLMRSRKNAMEADKTEYGYVKDLENMACGSNPRKLVFEQYVLAGYFEEILRAANLRFRKMTSGRYEMSRVGEVGDGRVKDNLEIQVMDYYTGKFRSVRTLSGGESFKASLCLALGMSDVIQAMNGGIRVDTLFIDEGFGALDSESLDQACETLMSLVEKNRLIGIISHVPELRERIDKQLIIDKTGSGSSVRSVV